MSNTRRRAGVLAMTATLLTVLSAGVAMADPATGQAIEINLGAATTSSLASSVSVEVVHCPPGGDLAALEVSFKNAESDPWTVVHAANSPWPGADADGCTSGVPTAASTAFPWTLASGADGIRTVYASFKHGPDVVYAQDNINYISPVTDTTAPVITYQVNGVYPKLPDGNNGWYVSNVSLDWTVTDLESSITLVGCDDTLITEDQQDTSYSCSATSAGGTAGPVTVSLKRDATAPTFSASLSPDPASNGWYSAATGAPKVTYTCSDATSGLASSCPPAVTLLDGANQSDSKTIMDLAGNSASAGYSAVNVDVTAPTVAVTGVAEGGTYTLGNVPTAACTTTDATSGVQSPATVATTGGSANGVGSFTATCSGAADNAGNTGSTAVSYTVNYGGVSGILQPINPDNTSIFKRGQAVPVKFMLAGDEFTGFDTSVWSLKRLSAPCGSFDADDAVVESVSSNTPAMFFRYDATADQYIYNADMKTTTVGNCYMFRVSLDSGQVLDSAVFKMAK